ncbi:hypothetical protein FBQ87_07595 [Sphingobacteriales bacterium CHB3]|nr:hypothetical protein [Sphingobacteriales bacterium CHB3]
MGIQQQPNLWQCGPFALKHALITLGIFAEEGTITRIAGSRSANGTDEVQLGRAARFYDCDLEMVRRHDAESARTELVRFLRRGIPVLICIYEWSHWVTVVKAESGKFILLDSREEAVLTILAWNELKSRWVYNEQDEFDEKHWEKIYDLHPVVPRFRVQTKAKFSLELARYLRRPENRALSRLWDQYLADLMTIAKPRTSLSKRVFSLGEFLRRHEQMILDQVDYWHGSINRRAAFKVLQNMHFVADTYGLVIHDEDEKRAIAGITSILALWAASNYGISPVYE